MGFGQILLFACSILYLSTGGRWTVVALVFVLYILYNKDQQQQQPPQPQQLKPSVPPLAKPKKESPIYAVDFTFSSKAFTPSTTTTFPIRRVIAPRPKDHLKFSQHQNLLFNNNNNNNNNVSQY